MGGMEKSTVYLTSEQKAALARAAESEGRSEARLIRAGVDLVIARHRAGESPAVLAGDVRGLPPRASTQVPSPSLERPRWIDREAFVALVLRHQADAGLRAELHDLAPGTTDDEPIP
jgi:hypothetical protein